MVRRAVWVLGVLAAGCSQQVVSPSDAAVEVRDSGSSLVGRDAGVADASVLSDAGGTDAGTADSGAFDAGSVGRFTYTVIDAGVLVTNGLSYAYQLLRFEVEGHAPSYGQYFPPPDGGTAPIVVVTQPYAAAAWTGEEVDSRWAAKATTYALYPDTDCPGADGGDSIIYQPMTVEDGLGQSFIYLYHGLGVLQIFERFYAGGSIQNDVDDTVAGFRFLAQERTVQKDAIAIFGGSWGGFEAVYGAMRAPESVRPKFGLVAYPLSDFEYEDHYLTHLDERFSTQASRDTMTQFFAPYRRRIGASTATQGFASFNAAAVRAELKTPLVIMHDEWDVLVPVDETKSLLDAGIGVDPFLLPHVGTPPWDTFGLDHFPVESEKDSNDSAVITFTAIHLIEGLVPTTQIIYLPVDPDKMHTFLVSQHSKQQALGGSMPALARRLNEIAEARIYVFVPGGSFTKTGIDWVTSEVNAIWGTSFTTANIKAQLAVGLP